MCGKAVLALGLLSLVALQPWTPAYGLDPTSLLNLPLHGALAKLGDEVRESIRAAREAGRAVGIEAGAQVNYAIQNFAAVYERESAKTVTQLDDVTRARFSELVGLVNGVTSQTDRTLSEFSSRTQQAVNTLPFRPREPQVTNITPRFTAPSLLGLPVRLKVFGNFLDAGDPQYLPTLHLGSKAFSPSEVQTQYLAFDVPSNEMPDMASAGPSTRLGIAEAQLHVPWKESKWLGLSSTRKEHVYRVILGRLPQAPGEIKVTRNFLRETDDESEKILTSGLRSDRHGGNDDHKDVPFEVKPDPGCQLLPNTHTFEVTVAGGNWSRQLSSADSARVVYNVTTIHHRFGESGHVDFRIRVMQRCPRKVAERVVETLNTGRKADLRWGERRTFSLKDVSSYVVEFAAFDGRKFEMRSPGAAGGFLHIGDNLTGDARSLEIRAVDPSSVQDLW